MSQKFVSNRDLAATALNALGLDKGQYMTGRILEEAYKKSTCHMNLSKGERSQITIVVALLCISHAWVLFK